MSGTVHVLGGRLAPHEDLGGYYFGYMDPRYPHLKGKHPTIRGWADQTTLEVHLEGGIVATWQTMHSEIHLEVK